MCARDVAAANAAPARPARPTSQPRG
jgi:hypothetical protein